MSINEDEAEISTSDYDEAPPLPCDKICLHQGDRICYNDMGDKELLKKIQEDENASGKTSESSESDSLHSGESLFKTFTFNAQDSDPDMEKCMSFWRSILEKNIKPVKCTLLKTKKNREKTVKERKPPQPVPPCDSEDTQKMWMDIYTDLQRRKLDKLKLVKTKKCDPCDEYIDEDGEKKQDVEDIKNLNHWKSQTKPTKFGKDAIKSQIHRALGELQTYKAQESPKTSAVKVETKEVIVDKTGSNHNDPPVRKESLKIDKPVLEAETVTMPETQLTEKRESVSETKRESIAKSEGEDINDETICCLCGCELEECICKEDLIVQMANQQLLQVDATDSCESCTCGNVCSCDHHKQVYCKCGCGVEGCICQSSHKGPCVCGCDISECVCQKLQEWPCSCGCGLEECMCQQLFTRSCKCGHADCQCDIIEVLSTYMESLESAPVVKMVSDDSKLSRESQTTDDDNWMVEATQKEGSYCVICGHFNCFCNVKKTNP